VAAGVLGPGRATAVAVEAGQRLGRAFLQLAADDVDVRHAAHAGDCYLAAWIHSPPMSEAPETNARIAEVREQLTLLRDYL
jgi:hypothetical protein